MATDATGTPTALGIPKFNTSVDAPSGLGSNAQMDSIDALITGRVATPAGILSGEVPVWNGSTWVRSTATNIGPTSLGSGSPDATKVLRGDGAWAVPAASLLSGYPADIAQVLRGDGSWAKGMSLIAVANPSASVVSFQSIPATFKHLVIFWNAAFNGASQQALYVQFNGDNGTNYDWSNLEVINGVTTPSNGNAGGAIISGEVGTSSSLYNGVIFFPTYLTTATGKGSFGMSAGRAVDSRIGIYGGRWTGVVAINRIDLTAAGGVFLPGSSFFLYGIGG